MSTLEFMVQQALLDPLSAARTHALGGGRVIGYFGAEIPVELIIACGAFPLRLPSFTQASPAADHYLESSFTPDVRSVAEQFLRGDFDFMDTIILPRSNDSAQRLYYYLCEIKTRRLVGGPRVLIYDLAKIVRATSVAHSGWATRRLAEEIGSDAAAIPAAIAQRNRRRELFAAAGAWRTRERAPRGSVVERMARAADFCSAAPFDAALAEWIRQGESHDEGPRLLLTGSAPPDDRLHQAAEAAGGNIVAEMGDHAFCGVPLPPIAADGAIGAIAHHYQSQSGGARAFVDRALFTRNLAQTLAVQGVIIWLTEQEDALIWDLPAQLSALKAAGIAALPMARRSWDGNDGALREIAAFTRGLKKAA